MQGGRCLSVSYWLVENHNQAAAHSSGKPWDDVLGVRIPPITRKKVVIVVVVSVCCVRACVRMIGATQLDSLCVGGARAATFVGCLGDTAHSA